MNRRLFLLFLLALLGACATPRDTPLQPGFVYLDQVLTSAIYDVRYYNGDNFVGRRIDGYEEERVILSRPAATALAAAEFDLRRQGLRFKIFDGYRPQRAVNDFQRWAADPGDTQMKSRFYPDVDKRDLFRLGYIAQKSGHSRGSTVDLTLVDGSGRELDMGSPFDFFGPISHHDTSLITPAQAQNRETLRNLMTRHGFEPYAEEWWHYTLRNEPFPDSYFDFPVE
ncbi:D-alanyl-D-alanine dipeptidase [compost metagenome]|uniref:D-alanyl-D-alanine dipeptidase n=1 Tax=Pseudomonas jinjuensis TaxID=198616 RepID=A0A1H0GA04_9PSED|nr:M15 family metallopeptidase [Pseudomonas jinjuensis]SDO03678.1 D-alanyl-D-alanine dipeptidase [Pseudomonas jinjuensis]